MIRNLYIDNLGLFKQTEIDFAPGLNVISGESGAGKTMLAKSFELLAGQKADPSLIGSSGSDSYVQATFDNKPPKELLELVDSDQELVLARRLVTTDKNKVISKALVCGRSSAAGHLEQAMSSLLTSSGQHASIELKKPAKQLEILDNNLKDSVALEAVKKSYKNWRNSEEELKELRNLLVDSERKIETLKADIEAYETVSPTENELEILEKEYSTLANSTELISLVSSTYEGLSGEQEVLDKLGNLSQVVEKISSYDPEWKSLEQSLLTSIEEIREISLAAQSSLESYNFSPERLSEVESRISEINTLKHRFRGMSLEDIHVLIESYQKELSTIDNSEEALIKLENKVKKLHTEYNREAKKLTEQRASAAKTLAKSTEKYLAKLKLGEAKLIITVEEAKPSALGSDQVKIELKANKHLQPVLLGQGASGGELSRVNLAISLSTYKTKSEENIFLFDEIDAGIGGKTAHAVGEMLAELARTNQVIVISHLAQIAVRADKNFLIEKTSGGAEVIALDKKATEKELVRLMGLDEDTASESLASMKKAASLT